MNFNDHFLLNDIAKAKLAFNNIAACLPLINSYVQKNDYGNAQRITISVLESLAKLNELAIKRNSANRMYLHDLMTQEKSWYPS